MAYLEKHDLSGPERGEINFEKLKNYLDSLEISGQSLPMTNGKPNHTAIAEAAGITRNSLYVNKKCIRLLNKFVGVEDSDSNKNNQVTTNTEAQSARIERLERRVMSLEQQLANCGAEKEDLRNRLREAEAKFKLYQTIEEEVIKTGRRVVL